LHASQPKITSQSPNGNFTKGQLSYSSLKHSLGFGKQPL
jgi:hypothetical protein